MPCSRRLLGLSNGTQSEGVQYTRSLCLLPAISACTITIHSSPQEASALGRWLVHSGGARGIAPA